MVYLCIDFNKPVINYLQQNLASSKSEDATVEKVISGQKHPNEKPDLIKGSYGPLKKHLSVTTMKGESIVLSENQARYKVSMDNNMFMYVCFLCTVFFLLSVD